MRLILFAAIALVVASYALGCAMSQRQTGQKIERILDKALNPQKSPTTMKEK